MSARWQSARRILCVRLDALGDVLMCTPAMRALRAALPGRRLTLLGSPSGAAVAPFVPEIDELIVHRAAWVKEGAAAASDAAALPEAPASPAAPGQAPPKVPPWPGTAIRDAEAGLALVATLAARRFDAAVIFTTYTQSALPAALLCQLAGIPLRLAHCRENPYDLLSDWVPEPESPTLVRHEVLRQLALVARVACAPPDLHLSFAPRPSDVAAGHARLRRAGVDPDLPWILLHPGASAASRRWPPALWARLLRLLASAPGLPLVLTGDGAETALVDGIRLAAGVPAVSLAGQLGLGELGAVLGMAAVAVTNNTGPAHIAAAVGTPLVDLYALTNPQHTPWAVPNRVLFQDVPCRFCYKSSCPAGHHACLAGVAPERVAAAVLELLPPRPPHAAASHVAPEPALPSTDAA